MGGLLLLRHLLSMPGLSIKPGFRELRRSRLALLAAVVLVLVAFAMLLTRGALVESEVVRRVRNEMQRVQQRVEHLEKQNLALMEETTLPDGCVMDLGQIVCENPPKASKSKAKTGNFQHDWLPEATKHPLPPVYGKVPESTKRAFKQACSRYRDSVPFEKRMLGISGLFNSGTNLLAALLDYNCNFRGRATNADGGSLNAQGPVLWQVPYGKHSPVGWKGKYHTGANVGRWTTSGGLLELKDMLPVVIVKDPLTWMGSMCRQRYAAAGPWSHDPQKCPRLVGANAAVNVKWLPEKQSSYSSMLDFWGTWNKDYMDSTTPKILVRFEDLLYDTTAALESVCSCAGGTLTRPVHIMNENVKYGGGHNNVAKASGHRSVQAKYADTAKRLGQFDANDLRFIRSHSAAKLMKRLGYIAPEISRQFNGMDLNGDGKISRKEWGQKYGDTDEFDKYDGDGDGTISAAEFHRADGRDR